MQTLRIYTSTGNVKLADLALGLDLQPQQVVLLPLAQLPRPLPARLGPLRLEQSQLKQQLATVEWSLEQLAAGQWQPDAGLENGLKAERDSLSTRLRGVENSITALQTNSCT